MKQNEYFIQIERELKKALPNHEVSLQEVPKNNGVILTGITIKDSNKNLVPIFYLDDWIVELEKGKSINHVVKEIVSSYEQSFSFSKNLKTENFTDFKKVKNVIRRKLINTERNQELLKTVPFQSFYDLSIVFYADLKDATFLITNVILDTWKISFNDLLNVVKDKPCNFQNMEDVIKSMMCEENEFVDLFEVPKSDFPMYVLTNEEKVFGAIAMLDKNLLFSISEKENQDLIILPSSVHELIVVPFNEVQINDVRCMVREVNETQVEKKDFLSNNIYLFSHDKKTITLI